MKLAGLTLLVIATAVIWSFIAYMIDCLFFKGSKP